MEKVNSSGEFVPRYMVYDATNLTAEEFAALGGVPDDAFVEFRGGRVLLKVSLFLG